MKIFKDEKEIATIKKTLRNIVRKRGEYHINAWVPALIALLLLRQRKPVKKEKRKLSKYNLFVSKHFKEGKSFKEIAKLWRAKK